MTHHAVAKLLNIIKLFLMIFFILSKGSTYNNYIFGCTLFSSSDERAASVVLLSSDERAVSAVLLGTHSPSWGVD